jgi:opacity protein-like surface antigen
MLDLTTSYVLAAGFNFGLSDMVSLSLDGSYADVDHYGSLFDGNTYTIRGGVAYTPVNNLTINTHVSYTASDFNTDALRVGVDDDEWSARFRVTRSF